LVDLLFVHILVFLLEVIVIIWGRLVVLHDH
jgi:hypothetical protein